MGSKSWWWGLVVVALVASRADAGLIFDNFSSTVYTPGVALEFDVVFDTKITGLNNYFVELILSASDDSATPGVVGDFYFDDAATFYPATGGVFGSAPGSGFFFAFASSVGDEDRLSLSDFLSNGEVDPVQGDILARVTIQATRDVGTLTLSIDGTTFDLANESGFLVPEFGDVVGNLPSPSSVPFQGGIVVVPEPATMTIWGFSCLVGGVVAFRRRRVVVSAA